VIKWYKCVKRMSSLTYVLFILFYAISYMSNAIYGTFFPVYLHNIGFTQTMIGALFSIGPIVAILAQPVWGTIGDRSTTKNKVLQTLILGNAGIMLFYPISHNFYYLLVLLALYTFFQTSIYPISDAITLEYVSKSNWKYGPIRMGGTVGYAIMSIVFGIIAVHHIGYMFWIYATVMLLSSIILTRLPVIHGHQVKGEKKSMLVIFRHKTLVLYFALTMIIQATLGYYYSFFPVFYHEMGASNAMLGWAMVASSISEIPFLLFADRLLERFQVGYVLLASACFAAIRWFLYFFVHNPYMILPIQLLHGLIFIVISVSLATYINREVPDELKASGQTLNGLLGLGVARIVGSYFGGVASQHFGMRNLFLYNSILLFASILVFLVIFQRRAIGLFVNERNASSHL
jgi:MFS transporter, PPP family, 3-phenylpropionic acid transporter